MPGTPRPAGEGPGRIPTFWNAILQRAQDHDRHLRQLDAGRTQTATIDAAGNTKYLSATNLAQTVFIGGVTGPPAAGGTPGVQVGTGLTGAGVAKQTGLVTTTITLTKGSTSATVGTSALTNGMVIGAANVTDPTSGIATPAITPGTTVQSGGGTTTITLSQAAAESGTGLYCAACTFTLI